MLGQEEIVFSTKGVAFSMLHVLCVPRQQVTHEMLRYLGNSFFFSEVRAALWM